MNNGNRILIVDDNKSIHDDFRKVLSPEGSVESIEISDLEAELFGDDDVASQPSNDFQQNYDIDSAYQGQEALSMIQKAQDEENPYSLVFMDVRMPPGWDGVETIGRIWSKFPYIEMVLCTAYSDYSWEEIIKKLGNTDKLLFLRKPFDTVAVQQMALTLIRKWNLGEKAKNYVHELEEEVDRRTAQLKSLLSELEGKNDELEEKNKELTYLALHDSLTKLPNRALFNDRLTKTLQSSIRRKEQFAVLLVDVNKFKSINDTLGHSAGDAVLYEVGERLSKLLRTSDTVARLGGDEFGLVLPNAGLEVQKIILTKIVEGFLPEFIFEEQEIKISISVGISIFPEHGDSSGELLCHADIAMYDAKRQKIGYAYFDAMKASMAEAKEKLVSELKYAIDGNELILHYQPIYNIETKKIVGVEALARWGHPEKGLLPPSEFIDLAEKRGLIQDITLWVFEKAFSQCATWHEKGLPVKVSVNISPQNFLDPELPLKLEKILESWNLAPEWVVLEITENVTIGEPKKALEIIDNLDKLGVCISIDDFGTGYSSLSHLRELPVKELKIDKSFVINMDNDQYNRLIVESTINLAKALGINIVAEGVECKEIFDLLQSLGCSHVQGFHLSRPKLADEITQLLSSNEHVDFSKSA